MASKDVHSSEQKPKKSFNQIMEELRQAEDQLINLSNEELKELFGDLKDKVDGVYNWESKLKFDILRVGEDIRKLQDRKKTLEGALKRFRDYMVFTLQSNDTEMLKGNMWDIKLRRRKSIKPIDREITSSDYLKLNYGEGKPVVKREYKWDAQALKTAYNANPILFKEYVKESFSEYVQFTASKDKK